MKVINFFPQNARFFQLNLSGAALKILEPPLRKFLTF